MSVDLGVGLSVGQGVRVWDVGCVSVMRKYGIVEVRRAIGYGTVV